MKRKRNPKKQISKGFVARLCEREEKRGNEGGSACTNEGTTEGAGKRRLFAMFFFMPQKWACLRLSYYFSKLFVKQH